MIVLNNLSDLVECQKNFQIRVKNDIPQNNFVSFDNVQESLKHNFFQEVEFQEFFEADTIDEQREELIDYLLFLVNKFIFLGVDVKDIDQPLDGLLWSFKSNSSFSIIDSFSRLEQNSYISFIRNHTIYKPWKSHDNISCVDGFSNEYFIKSLDYYRNISNIMFDNYGQFYEFLIKKLDINIYRQNNNY